MGGRLLVCKVFKLGFVALSLMLVGACSSYSVRVASDFPVPVMEQQPFVAGLLLDQTIRNYRYQEDEPERAAWTVEFGESNARLFQQIFTGMFKQLLILDQADLKQLPPNIDILLQPVLMDYQISTPAVSKSDYFEVWIKYKLRVADTNRRPVTDWGFTAYGRTPKSGAGGPESALQEATRRAMRDAAAAIVTGFLRQPGVQAYLNGLERSIQAQRQSPERVL